jgi:hypothetical protein
VLRHSKVIVSSEKKERDSDKDEEWNLLNKYLLIETRFR